VKFSPVDRLATLAKRAVGPGHHEPAAKGRWQVRGWRKPEQPATVVYNAGRILNARVYLTSMEGRATESMMLLSPPVGRDAAR